MNNTHGGKRRGAGRKKLETARRIILSQRYTEKEHKFIENSAAKIGLSITDYVRLKVTE